MGKFQVISILFVQEEKKKKALIYGVFDWSWECRKKMSLKQ